MKRRCQAASGLPLLDVWSCLAATILISCLYAQIGRSRVDVLAGSERGQKAGLGERENKYTSSLFLSSKYCTPDVCISLTLSELLSVSSYAPPLPPFPPPLKSSLDNHWVQVQVGTLPYTSLSTWQHLTQPSLPLSSKANQRRTSTAFRSSLSHPASSLTISDLQSPNTSQPIPDELLIRLGRCRC